MRRSCTPKFVLFSRFWLVIYRQDQLCQDIFYFVPSYGYQHLVRFYSHTLRSFRDLRTPPPMQLSRQKMHMSLTVEKTICKLRIHQSAGQLWHLDVSEIFSHLNFSTLNYLKTTSVRAIWNIHLFTVIRALYLLIVNRMEKGIEYGTLQGQYKFFSAISRTFINGRKIYGGCTPPFTIFSISDSVL